jgi:hypothetical protein
MSLRSTSNELILKIGIILYFYFQWEKIWKYLSLLSLENKILCTFQNAEEQGIQNKLACSYFHGNWYIIFMEEDKMHIFEMIRIIFQSDRMKKLSVHRLRMWFEGQLVLSEPM